MKWLLIFVALLTCSSVFGADRYAVGQVWEYKTRPEDAGSLLRIAKIEKDPEFGIVYHISVVGLRITNPKAPGGRTTEVVHYPVSKGALDSSVTHLSTSKVTFPDVERGYPFWRSARDQGQAGVYEMPIADIVTLSQQLSNQVNGTRAP